MLTRNVIEKLIAAADAQPVRVNAAACLNAKHKERHCDACLACPTDAIQLRGAQVELDSARCVECGLCAAVCPTRVFTTQENDAAILNAVAAFANVEFACPRKTDFETTRAPKVAGARQVTCLARLSPELLTALAAEHETVWLDDSPCADCPIGARAHPQILAARDAANRLLAAWNRGGVVRCYADSELGAARKVGRIGNPNESLSRREFFSFFRSNAGRAVVAASLSGSPKADSDRVAPDSETFSRALAKLGTPAAETVASERLATIQVAESCTACGLCAKICPTHAMEFRADGGYYVLAIQPRTCLGDACGLCALICPAHAITLTPGIARDALTVSDPAPLRSGALTICRQCNTPFAAEPGQALCPVCREIEAKRAALTRGLFKPKL